MDFSDVFRFFSEAAELTPERRTAELVCVAAAAVLLGILLGALLVRRIRKYKAEEHHAHTQEEPDPHAEN